jgi:serine/threonine protein kinase
MTSNFFPGARLGRYEINSQLGAGGMGEVYLAQDTILHRNVARKVLPADVSANQDRMRRFRQEAQAAAALNHPNIAHIYEIVCRSEDESSSADFSEPSAVADGPRQARYSRSVGIE